ncbi:MAG: prenyltransferase [Acidimicrobiales bacterium]
MTGPLTAVQVSETASWIAGAQLPNGMIPWFPGGHADPWNHTESAMALVLAGRRREADGPFEWLASTQLGDGTWCRYHLAEGIEVPRRDPNVGVYVATGAWWHYLCTGDLGLLEAMWPVIDGAVAFVLRLQQAGREVLWSMDPDGHVGRYALLICTASIHHSLRCAVAERLGFERPEWELAADRIVEAIVHRPVSFAPKAPMDWYYPALSGALSGDMAQERIDGRWSDFVLDGVGVRCVTDQHWVTAAETAECAVALDAIGMRERAATLLGWTLHLRDADGAYWTGCVHPECVRNPGGERSTYTAAVLLADHALYGYGQSAGLFRGETLPTVVDVSGVTERLGEG